MLCEKNQILAYRRLFRSAEIKAFHTYFRSGKYFWQGSSCASNGWKYVRSLLKTLGFSFQQLGLCLVFCQGSHFHSLKVPVASIHLLLGGQIDGISD